MTALRPSTVAFGVLSLATAAFVLCLADAAIPRERRSAELAETRALVARLGLTDLSLFTEARYTRHPTQADLHSAFQDHPLALEHFPTGSLMPPRREQLDRTPARAD